MRIVKVAAAVVVSYVVAHMVFAAVFAEVVEAFTGSQSTGLWYAENAAPVVAVVIAFFAGRYAVRLTERRAAGARRV